MTARDRFGAATTAAEVLEGISLTGRRAIVTGASGGLGAETARALAAAGAAVTLAARDTAKADAVADSIRTSTGNGGIEVAGLDLSSQQSVRCFARDWLASHAELNLLINNAGIMACPLARSAEGYELQFATNHLGHFLLTGLLLPALRAGAPARVVNVSSAGHRFGGVRFDDIHFEQREYDKWIAYGQSKTANVLFSVELDRRFAALGVRSFAVHPGVIATDLARHMTPEDLQAFLARVPAGGPRWKSVAAGAATALFAATAPELAGRGGLYLEDCGISEPMSAPDATSGHAAHAVDPRAAAQLWRVSEELVGERFDA